MPQMLLEVENLKKHFPIKRGLFSKIVGKVYAVDGISLRIDRKQTLGLVGESGCGKTTAGKTILNSLSPPAAPSATAARTSPVTIAMK